MFQPQPLATHSGACTCCSRPTVGQLPSKFYLTASDFFCRHLRVPSMSQQNSRDEQHQPIIGAHNEQPTFYSSICKPSILINQHTTSSFCRECNGSHPINESSATYSTTTTTTTTTTHSSQSPLATAISIHYEGSSYKLSKLLQQYLWSLSTEPPIQAVQHHGKVICAKAMQPSASSHMATTIDPRHVGDKSNLMMAAAVAGNDLKDSNNNNNNDDNDTSDSCKDSLDKDTDGGYAWVILAVVFVINASTFGTARAYGLIFDKLAREDEQSRAQAALPFTIMGAIENMAGPLSGYMLAKTGSWRLTVCLGSFLITLAHLMAAVCDSQAGQLLSMGLMCGFGLSLVTISFFQVNNAYFVRYRSTAFGLGLTGAALGTLYISPLCQYSLDNYGTNACYLMLGLILFPNVPLALLLKPKKPRTSSIASKTTNTTTTTATKHVTYPIAAGETTTTTHPTKIATTIENVLAVGANPTIPTNTNADDDSHTPNSDSTGGNIQTISGQLTQRDKPTQDIWMSIKLVISNPIFHLIWPTQLLFCWFNFVFGMIIVDFGKDRGLSSAHVAQLVPIWAFGQLVGRMVLGSLVDLKYITYKSFTVICFASIGMTTWALNNIHAEGDYLNLIVSILVFTLSMFIALLYILFNGLVVNYVEPSLQSLSIGISSFTGSFFLLPRASIIGYYRDTTGNYDAMLTMFTYTALLAALSWLVIPFICARLRSLWLISMRRHTNKALENLQPYSSWILNSKKSTGSGGRIDIKTERSLAANAPA